MTPAGGGRRRLGNKAVIRFLRGDLRRAQRASTTGKVFLDLFGGVGGVCRAWQAQGHGVVCIDAARCEWHDVCRPACAREIVRWIRLRKVAGAMCAFPCTTWSRARHPPLRTSSCLFGKPNLQEKEKVQVQIGNQTFLFTGRVVKAANAVWMPIVCENPVGSMAWIASPMAELRALASKEASTDMCQFACRWRKRTRLVGWQVSRPPADLFKLCSSGAVCSATGRPHLVLRGTMPGTGIAYTRIAQAYPTQLATKLALWISQSSDHRDLIMLQKHVVRTQSTERDWGQS